MHSVSIKTPAPSSQQVLSPAWILPEAHGQHGALGTGTGLQMKKLKSLTILIHLINHLLQLLGGGVLPQHSHHLPQLLGADAAILCPQHEDVEGSLKL